MDDATHVFTGETVTAAEVKDNFTYWSSSLLMAFSCPLCRHIVFFYPGTKNDPHFRHQAHRGESCQRYRTANESRQVRSSEQSEIRIQIADEILRQMGEFRTISEAESIDIDRWVAASILGEELLQKEERDSERVLQNNALTLLYHPYFSILLRALLVSLARGASDGPSIDNRQLAKNVREKYNSSPLMQRLERNTIHRKLQRSQYATATLPGDGPHEFTFARRREFGGTRVGATFMNVRVDRAIIETTPCRLLFRLHPSEQIPMSLRLRASPKTSYAHAATLSAISADASRQNAR